MITGLESDRRYYYVVGHAQNASRLEGGASDFVAASPEYHFDAPPVGSADWAPNVTVFGDMGYFNARALPVVAAAASSHATQAVLHLGGIAFNLESWNGAMGAAFLAHAEAVSAYVPYMVAAGEEERFDGFQAYQALFAMPDGVQAGGPARTSTAANAPLWYSFDIGKAHVVVYCTELEQSYASLAAEQVSGPRAVSARAA